MVHFKDRYKVESFCSSCKITVPSIKSVFDKYGYMVAVKQPWEYPRVYDDKGNTYQLNTLVPIRQVNRCGLDGTLFEEIREFKVNVFCPQCGKQCRDRPLSKTKYNEVKEKTVHTIGKVGINLFGKPKVEPIDSKVKLVKKSKEYIYSPDPVGRPKGRDKNKETVEECFKRIKQTKNTMWELTLDDVPPHLRSKVKRRIDKENEGKESNIDN